MNKKTLDMACGLLGIGVAAAMYMAAAAFPERAYHAAQYVKFLTTATMILCAVLFITAALSKKGGQVAWVKARRPFTATLVLTLAYVALTYVLGFYAASALYMIGLALALGYRRPVSIVLSTALLLVVIWGVFEKFLAVPIPTGFWGF